MVKNGFGQLMQKSMNLKLQRWRVPSPALKSAVPKGCNSGQYLGWVAAHAVFPGAAVLVVALNPSDLLAPPGPEEENTLSVGHLNTQCNDSLTQRGLIPATPRWRTNTLTAKRLAFFIHKEVG